THVLREHDPLTVLEGPALAIGFDRHARVTCRPHADDFYGLEISPILAGRLDPPFLEVIGNVGRREPQPLGVDLTALKLVGGDVAEPLLQRLRLDGVDAALRRWLGA